MSYTKTALSKVLNCDECYGAGYFAYSTDSGEFEFEYCECNPYRIPQVEIIEYKEGLVK